jgi:zinc transport system substrate-binding protein
MSKERNPIRILTFLFLVVISVSLSACQTSTQTEQNQDELQVIVSILPQAYFVERIGGGQVSVQVMVGPGEEAHTYEPSPEQMKDLSTADLFFTIGIEYEETWVPRFIDINPDLTFFDSAEGIIRIPVADAHDHDEDHEEISADSDQSHEEGLDPHVWLSPQNGKIIARNILAALIEVSPQNKQTFEENYDALIADIDQLDESIRSSLAVINSRTFMVFHPAWGYFADQYDLEQVSVQVGGQDPSPSEMAALVDIARDEAIRVIFVQPSFNSEDAQSIAKEINAEIASVDPLSRDWLMNLENVAAALAAALEQ